MSYARARLWLGMGNVGAVVVLAASALAVRLPERLLGAFPTGWYGDLVAILSGVGVVVALQIPFDLPGGWLLPRRFGRPTPTASGYALGLLRGILLQASALIVSGLVLLAAGRLLGLFGLLLAGSGIMLTLLATQGSVSRLLARGDVRPAAPGPAGPRSWGAHRHPVVLQDAADPGFSGGVSGWPGRERIVLPASWESLLTSEQLAAQVARRQSLLRSGSRFRGVLLAVGWNLAGLTLGWLAAGRALATVADLASVALGFTLWSFIGLLVLPTPSRRGVMEADRLALGAGVPRELLEETMQAVDRMQDDEPERPGLVETIFHPVPSVSRRRAALASPAPARGYWQAARMSLFLSWGCLGLLARSVHCNCGRPELWAFLPSD